MVAALGIDEVVCTFGTKQLAGTQFLDIWVADSHLFK